RAAVADARAGRPPRSRRGSGPGDVPARVPGAAELRPRRGRPAVELALDDRDAARPRRAAPAPRTARDAAAGALSGRPSRPPRARPARRDPDPRGGAAVTGSSRGDPSARGAWPRLRRDRDGAGDLRGNGEVAAVTRAQRAAGRARGGPCCRMIAMARTTTTPT